MLSLLYKFNVSTLIPWLYGCSDDLDAFRIFSIYHIIMQHVDMDQDAETHSSISLPCLTLKFNFVVQVENNMITFSND